MTRARDLAEAHAHVRRRLGDALVAVEPVGGLEPEPDRPGRRLVLGLLLTALLLGAGAAPRLLDDDAGPGSSPGPASSPRGGG